MTVHAYALTTIDKHLFFWPQVPVIEFGHMFRLQRLFPDINLGGIMDKFNQIQDYGKFAPHIERTHWELVVDEKDWEDVEVGNGIRFADLSDDDKIACINGAVSILLTLIRLKGCYQFIVPMMIHNSSFSEIRSADNGSITAHFFPQQNLIQPMMPPVIPHILDHDDIEWIMKHHVSLGKIFHEGRKDFLIDIFDTMVYPNPKVQLVITWAAIEAIVQPEKDEENETGIRHSLRSRCSMILCESADEQMEKYKQIGKLYDLRSDTVHGKDLSLEKEDYTIDDVLGLVDSFSLLKDLLISIIEKGEMPTIVQLRDLQAEFNTTHY